MTPVLTPPPLAPVRPSVAVNPPVVVPQPPPLPFRWTLTDYRRLAKTGFLDDKRTMLLDGVLYVMPNPKPPHDISLGVTDEWLRAVFADTGYHVRNQVSFNVGEDTDPGPDLAVVPGVIRDYARAAPTVAVLIVEVAESSLFIDTTTKAEKYATANVPEYWVIDLEHRLLLVYRDPVPLPAGLGATAYRTQLTLTDAESVSPLAAPGATIRVADLLP